jgi:hypothetical protein
MATTAKKHVYLSDLHFEHSLWLNELDFSKDELGIFTNRLSGVVDRNTDNTFEASAERFQNQLILQENALTELRHDIKKHESELVNFAKEHPIAIDHVHFTDHVGLRERMTRFTALYAEFKKDFMHFIAQWM